MENDTIAAIATPAGSGGVAVIRISGTDAPAVLEKVFIHNEPLEHAHMVYGRVMEGSEVLDTGLAVSFYAPHSFTGEDVAELHLHGSGVGVARVLDLVFRSGARPADAGEFSRRAFLNGKMDLTQAEAICDYISSVSLAGAKASSRQMQGVLKETMLQCQGRLTDVIAQIEAVVEYPEEDLEFEVTENVTPIVLELKNELEKLSDSYDQGKIIKNGLHVAIVGKPNAGKSSLLNALAKYDRVIVSDIPGTTRDTIEQEIRLKDIVVHLIDTAGIRRTDDEIEGMGIERSENAIKSADLVIFVLDTSKILCEQDDFISNQLKKLQAKVIPVFNKLDCSERKLQAQNFPEDWFDMIPVSAKTGAGLEELREQIYLFAVKNADENVIITNERHKYLLDRALLYLEDALDALSQSEDMDCVTIDLNAAWMSMGELTGNTVSEDIIDRVFEKFCLGK